MLDNPKKLKVLDKPKINIKKSNNKENKLN